MGIHRSLDDLGFEIGDGGVDHGNERVALGVKRKIATLPDPGECARSGMSIGHASARHKVIQ
jgi:hypothetical protein